MEEKKYEGTVQITSAEYRELVTQAVEVEKDYEVVCSAKLDLERKVSALENELAETQKELDTYRKQFARITTYNNPPNLGNTNLCTTADINRV